MSCLVEHSDSPVTVIIKVMNLLITEVTKPTSDLPVAGFIRSSSDWSTVLLMI